MAGRTRSNWMVLCCGDCGLTDDKKNGGYLTIITANRQMVVVRQACNVASVNSLQATFNKKSFTK